MSRARAHAIALCLLALQSAPARAGQSTKVKPIVLPATAGVAPALAAPTPALPGQAPNAVSIPAVPQAAAAPLDTTGQLIELGAQLGARPADHGATLEAAWEKTPGRPDSPAQAADPRPPSAARKSRVRLTLPRASIQDLIVHGVPSGIARVTEGDILFWDPAKRPVDPYLTAPNDDPNMVQAKVRNEIEGLRRVWLDLKSAYAETAATDELIERAAGEIERDKLKAEVVLERLAAKDDRVAKELMLALKNRSALLYLSDNTANFDLASFHEDLKRLEKSRVLNKVFDRFLRLLYGFDAKDEESAEGERLNADSRRMAMGEFLPLILKEIDAGKTAEQALNAALEKARVKVEALKAQVLKDPKNSVKKKNFTFLEEVTAAFEAVKDGLRAYDYVYEQGDLPDQARSKREAELMRHEETWALLLARIGDPPAALREILADFQVHMRREILTEGRPLQYAAAEFFHRRQDSFPEGFLDLLMFYSHAARGGAKEAAKATDLVILAEDIRDEADYQDLLLSFREHGRVASIITVGSPDKQGGSRMPHWVIFAKADGIVPVPWARLDAHGLSLAGLAGRLQGPGGKPARAVVNGRRGQAIINPSSTSRGAWLKRASTYERLGGYYGSRASQPAAFAGVPIRFLVDEADPKAFEAAAGPSALEASGAAGVGLLRMEQFMRELGVEWDQAPVSAALQEMLTQPLLREGAPLIVRLFDFEADKRPKFLRESEAVVRQLLKTHSNVRFYLDKSRPEFREFGKMQLKALFDAHLSARPAGNLRILFSNVRDKKEIQAIEELFDEASAEYLQDRDDAAAVAGELARIPIGYMVEDVRTVKRLKPFMAEIAKLRQSRPAERFLAFGTNDYQSSLLRDDPQAIEKLAKLDPRLVLGIWTVASAAAAQGLAFTVDGEWGSSPKLLLVLLALRAFHGVEATPVVYPGRAPELYELVRAATVRDLAPLKGLLKRLQGKRKPAMAPFDETVGAIADRIEDRILRKIPPQE